MTKYFRLLVLLVLLVWIVAACSVNISPVGQPTPTEVPLRTATLPPTLTPRPSATPLPSTVQAAQIGQSAQGVTTTKVNVRPEPNTTGDVLGILDSGQAVEITGKDPGGNWLQIVYPDGPDGKGWVSKAYISTEGKKLDVPVLGAGGAPVALEGNSGVLLEQVNVRSGPGIGYDPLGLLNPQDVVTLTGKTDDEVWLQIEYAAGPDGKGWVAAGYVQASGVENLPIVAETGQVVGTETPTPLPATVTPTLVAAVQDDDSIQSPAVNVVLSASGSRSFSYSSDVSSPNGDSEDWVAFSLEDAQGNVTKTVYTDLTCQGNGKLIVELWQGNQPSKGWEPLTCGDSHHPLTVYPGQTYSIRLRAKSASDGLQYVNYTLTIQSP
jgi:uncharacterized protein YraI